MAIRALIVEDSPTQAAALQAHLEAADYLVTTASNAVTALELLAPGAFDLVISDIVMPGTLDGYGLCTRIKAGTFGDVPVVLLTSLADPMDIIRGLECGADNFLTKPYDPEQLLTRLNVLLDTRRARASHRVSTGTRILFLGREYTITSEREQILDLLITTFEEAVRKNRALQRREDELEEARAQLADYARSLEARLRGVLESVPDMLFSGDPALSQFRYASPGVMAVLGMTADELEADAARWWDRINQDDLPHVQHAAALAAATMRPQQVEFRYRHPVDSQRWLQVSLVGAHDRDTDVVSLNGVMRDVTDHRQRATLLEMLRLVAVAVNAAPDFESALQTVVDQVCAHTGWPVGHVFTFDEQGGHSSPIWHLADPVRFAPFRAVTDAPGFQWEAALPGKVRTSGNAEWCMDFINIVPHQRREAALITDLRSGFAFPVSDEGRIIAVVEFFRDAPAEPDAELLAVMMQIGNQLGRLHEHRGRERERRLAEDQLRQSQKMEAVGRLAGGIAHDFNNMLMVILGEAGIALEEEDGGGTARPALESIVSAGHRAAEMTRQLLAFSRRQVFEPKVFDMNHLVTDIEGMLRRLIGESLVLQTQLTPGLPPIRADRGQVEQVLVNLVVNARDAMPDGGTLTISTADVLLDEDYARLHPETRVGRHVTLQVSDTGTGMPPDVLNRIFEPFFTTKEQGKGTGLGLATSFGIVKQSGGQISAYSEPGLGTTMRVHFPAVEDALDSDVRPEVPMRTGTETILLLEDDVSVRKVVARMLSTRGFEVIAVGDHDAAFAAVAERPDIDLLITDVVLPGLNGGEVADRVKALRPDLKVLFISGYTDDVILHHRILREGASLVQKPFDSNTLTAKIRDVLGGPGEG